MDLPFDYLKQFKENLKRDLDNLAYSEEDELCQISDNVYVNDSVASQEYYVSTTELACSPIEPASQIDNRRSTRSSTRILRENTVNTEIMDTSCLAPAQKNTKKRNGRKTQTTRTKRKNQPSQPMVSEEVIEIDDDDDDDDCCIVEDKCNNEIADTSSVDIDYINEELNIKIHWMMMEPLILQLRRYETFSKIFSKISEEKNVNKDRILLYNGDYRIKSIDTPDSIDLKIIDILVGFASSAPILETSEDTSNQRDENCNPNKLQLKIITDSLRNNVTYYSINKGQKMIVLLLKIASKLNKDVSDISLWFDGEKINGNSSTDDLDLEGGECFELKVK